MVGRVAVKQAALCLAEGLTEAEVLQHHAVRVGHWGLRLGVWIAVYSVVIKDMTLSRHCCAVLVHA